MGGPEVIHLEVGSPTFLRLRTSSTLPTGLRGRAIPATLQTRAFLSCVKPWRTRSPGATVTRRARAGSSHAGRHPGALPGASSLARTRRRNTVARSRLAELPHDRTPSRGACSYPLVAQGDFLPRPEDLERLVTPRTRAILVNSPSNPLGTVLPAN